MRFCGCAEMAVVGVGGVEIAVVFNERTTWVECTSCKKWRLWGVSEVYGLPPDGDWTCGENRWDTYNSCDVDEQPSS